MTIDRRTFLGASDVAAALGLSTHKTPREVWREKVAPAPIVQVDNEDMLRGRASEPVIEALLALRGEILQPGGEWPIDGTPLIVHPDRLRATALGREVVEFKAPRRLWAEDAPPQEYVVQVLVQAFACGARACRLVALCGDLRDYPIAWDREAAERLVELATRWWEYHVVGGNEPPPVSRREIARVVPSLPAVTVSDHVVNAVRRLKAYQFIAKEASKVAERMKDLVLGQALVGQDLPASLRDASGTEVATIVHGRRAGYTVEPAEWNSVKPSKTLAVADDVPSLPPEALDETSDVTLG